MLMVIARINIKASEKSQSFIEVLAFVFIAKWVLGRAI
jgi:hypothetical protein